jgi:general stress protein 26
MEPMKRKDGLAKLATLIDGIDIAMLTTRTPDGRMHSRPLRAQELDGDAAPLWSITDRDSNKADEVQAQPQVNGAYASPSANTYASIAGRAQVVFDKARLHALWTPAMSIFYPQGKDDPALCLLRVDIDSAEYWDSPGGLVGNALYLASAALTGDAGALSENARMDLRQRH